MIRDVKRISFESNFACENEIRFLKVPAEFRFCKKKVKKTKQKIIFYYYFFFTFLTPALMLISLYDFFPADIFVVDNGLIRL